MTIISWQPILAQLDADPDVTTAAGQSVLKALLAAGKQYDAARSPDDVQYESEEHRLWTAKRPSERIGTKEPAFYVAAYYDRPFTASASSGALNVRYLELPAAAPADAHAAFKFWQPRDAGVARNIARYYIAAARDAALAAQPLGPSNGAIESSLVSALAAAEAWLEAP